MAIVSISEAARITGKARSTIQSHIKTGKLSKTTDSHTGTVGVDISELIRCFGESVTTPIGHVVNEQISQQTTGNTTPNTTGEIALLQKEIELLKQIIEEKDEHNKSLKQAMLLLENKEIKNKKKWWWQK